MWGRVAGGVTGDGESTQPLLAALGTMQVNELPQSLKAWLAERWPDEAPLVAARSDLAPDGTYGEQWLVGSASRLWVVAVDGDSCALRAEHRLDAFDKIEHVGLVGSGVVEVETGSGRERLLIYTNACSQDMAWAIEDITTLKDGKELDTEHLDRKNLICETCGFPMGEELNKCPRCSQKGKTLRRVLGFTLPYRVNILFIFLAMLTTTAFGLVIPYMSKLFIDLILKPDADTGEFVNGHLLPWAALALLLAYAGQLFFGGVQERLSGSMGFRTVFDVRAAIYEKLQRLSLAYFDKHQTGAIMARVNQDTAELQRFLVDFIPLSLESLFTLIGVGVFLFILSWKLTLFVFVPVVATVLFLRFIFPRVWPVFRRYFHRRARLSALVNDSISGARVVKAFGQEEEEITRFDKRSSQYRDAGIDLVRKWSLYHPILHFFIMFGSVLVWFVGGHLVIGGGMTLGSVVAYSGYLMMFYRPVFILTRMVQMITNSLIAAERVFAVMDTEPRIVNAPDAVKKPRIEGRVEFRNVVFGYDALKPVIKDISFTIEPNEVIGLVGKSGAGKSTIINLFCRLYDADKGAVLVDDTDVRKIDYTDLRSQIGVVLQETFLFNGSIFENIAYARPGATRREVIEAAMAANAHEFIVKKPDGYDTNVGERGDSLSGGEKQRVSIARAILRDPRILILDEATSSVDTETEGKIQQALEVLMRGRTTITIAHRLSTLRNCNRLFVIEEGELAEAGSHAELMKNENGVFRKLVDTQQELSRIIAVNG